MRMLNDKSNNRKHLPHPRSSHRISLQAAPITLPARTQVLLTQRTFLRLSSHQRRQWLTNPKHQQGPLSSLYKLIYLLNNNKVRLLLRFRRKRQGRSKHNNKCSFRNQLTYSLPMICRGRITKTQTVLSLRVVLIHLYKSSHLCMM